MELPGRKKGKRNFGKLSRGERKQKALLKVEFEEFLRSGRTMLSPEKSKALLEKLHDSIMSSDNTTQRTSRVTFLLSSAWARGAAAAVVLLMAGTAWRHFHTGHKTGGAMVAAVIHENAVIVQSNNSDTIRNLVLSDHSIIELAQGSTIRYHTSFNTGKRDILLSGKAIFEVAKDMKRPFTVYAGGISTTVLGTRFMMSTQEKDKVKVKLFEGKVVIRSTQGNFAMKDVYLHAGERFVTDNQLKKFNVTSFKDSTDTLNSNTATATPGSNAIANDQPLEFNQEPLGKVLARIGKRYKVQFKFRDDSFNNMLVTGKLLPSDSLDVVLSMLGNINGLSFKKRNNGIEVTKIP